MVPWSDHQLSPTKKNVNPESEGFNCCFQLWDISIKFRAIEKYLTHNILYISVFVFNKIDSNMMLVLDLNTSIL